MIDFGTHLALGVLLEYVVKFVIAGTIIVRSRGTPQVRLTWLLVVLAVPLIGLVLYFAIGGIRLERRRLERYSAAQKAISKLYPPPRQNEAALAALGVRSRKTARLAESVSDTWLRPGNRLWLYSETDHTFDHMIEDIDAARVSCNLLFYIYLPDGNGTRVAEALKRAAARGVTCRLLVDAIGAKPLLKSTLSRSLREAGVHVERALPAGALRALFERIDHRNHRKIAVIDGRIGWTGSQNVADAAFAIKPRFAPWIDLMIRIEGPAVYDLQVLFTEDWLQEVDDEVSEVLTPPPEPLPEGVPVQVIGTGPLCFNEALEALMQMGILQAEEELILTTPYFVPDETTLAALRTSALCDVRTVLIVPARNDSPLVAAASRSYYQTLLEAGVEIHEYRPGLLHAKTISIDGKSSVVATANIDRRSYELNSEVSVIVYDETFTRRLRAVQHAYIRDSVPVALDHWRKRGWHRALAQNTAGVFAPLL